MEHITICTRTKKEKGIVRLRFRLRDGRSTQLYHKSNIEADLSDLTKFTPEGTPRPKVSVYNISLANKIAAETDAMHKAYTTMREKSMVMDSNTFEDLIHKILNNSPDTASSENNTLLARFAKYTEAAYRDGIIGKARYRHYLVMQGKLERYLTIKQSKNITPAEFNDDWLLDLRQFIFDEYKYVKKYKSIYSELNLNSIPEKRRSLNTVTTNMKLLQPFFNELENKDEIPRNPFRRLGAERRKVVLRSKYDDPIFLLADEFQTIMNTEVPASLQDTKNAFLLQCAFGCRISDFLQLSMEKISITQDGIPYIHYLPLKTRNKQTDNREIETPIIYYALGIIKATQFHFPITKYVFGKSGYNVKIKELLRFCNIDRKVAVFDEDKGDNVYKPLYELASTKLCRKTHVDMMNKVQINMYAAGLHKDGSDAVERYTKLDIRDRFILMCAAFNQPLYKVDKDLNIID